MIELNLRLAIDATIFSPNEDYFEVDKINIERNILCSVYFLLQ